MKLGSGGGGGGGSEAFGLTGVGEDAAAVAAATVGVLVEDVAVLAVDAVAVDADRVAVVAVEAATVADRAAGAELAGAELAGAELAGVIAFAIVAVADAVGMLPATCIPDVLAAGAAAGVGVGVALGLAAVAVPSLLRSAMFLESSATRAALSLACLSLAMDSSLALAATEPLLSVSLSGVLAPALGSLTLACTLPLAARVGAVATAVGAPEAKRRRNSLKSLAWTEIVCLASPAPVAGAAATAACMSITAPDLSRLTLFPTNASGLVLSIATSI